MILLKKKKSDGTYFEFDKILREGYSIFEDNDRTTQKFVNGNRKQIVSEYVDVKITIDLGTLDLETTANYLNELTNGEYQYYSIQDKTYKNIKMLIENKPTIVVQGSFGNNSAFINDYSVTLLKAGDV